MDDPYVYPGTNVLRNKEGIRDAGELAAHERLMTAARIRVGMPKNDMTPAGYCQLHHHMFQDVYDWAGQVRTVPISKGGDPFCLPQFIDGQLAKRFNAIHAENDLRGISADQFAVRAAEHLSELNAIHPFREGNGRTKRAFLKALGEQAGHEIALDRIKPRPWNEASIESFRTAETVSMRLVIADALADPRERKTAVIEARLAKLEIERRQNG